MVLKENDVVRVNYAVKCENEVIDTNIEKVAIDAGIFDEKKKYKPLVVVVSEPFLFEKIKEELKKADVGKKLVVELKPNEAFGERKAELIGVVPLSEFKKRKISPFPGLIVEVNGRLGRVQSISGGRVRVDFNNPYAGKPVTVELEVVEKVEKDPEKLKALVEKFFNGAKVDAKLEKDKVTLRIEKPSLELERQKYGFISYVFRVLGSVKKVEVSESFEEERKK